MCVRHPCGADFIGADQSECCKGGRGSRNGANFGAGGWRAARGRRGCVHGAERRWDVVVEAASGHARAGQRDEQAAHLGPEVGIADGRGVGKGEVGASGAADEARVPLAVFGAGVGQGHLLPPGGCDVDLPQNLVQAGCEDELRRRAGPNVVDPPGHDHGPSLVQGVVGQRGEHRRRLRPGRERRVVPNRHRFAGSHGGAHHHSAVGHHFLAVHDAVRLPNRGHHVPGQVLGRLRERLDRHFLHGGADRPSRREPLGPHRQDPPRAPRRGPQAACGVEEGYLGSQGRRAAPGDCFHVGPGRVKLPLATLVQCGGG